MENNNEPVGASPAIDRVQPMQTEKQGFWHDLGEFARFAAIVVVVVIVVRVFIAQPFIVSGTSMVPTFENNNYLIVDELSYRFETPHRGDVIIFHPPIDPSLYYIKRIIGVPGDTIAVRNGIVTLTNADHPNGIVLSEPYLSKDTLTENTSTVVTEGNYFVMGDNRSVSYDSRRWGLLPAKNITGRAFLRLFPISKIGVFPGEYQNY